MVSKVLIKIVGYLLSRKEGRVGSPEKPLSGLGEVTYRKYWRLAVFQYLRTATDAVTMDGECCIAIEVI